MTHRLTTNYAKNYYNRTLIVKFIVENVVTCFFGTQCICDFLLMVNSNHGRITYRLRDIFAYTELDNRNYRPLYFDCSRGTPSNVNVIAEKFI